MNEDKYYFEKEIFSKKNHKFDFDFDKDLIKEVLKLNQKGKVLDLGCGEGGNGLKLAENGFEVTCVDISKTSTSRLKKEFDKRNPSINILCRDLDDYEIDENYDVILCTGVLHFVSKKKVLNILKQIQKHTNKQGMNVLDVFLEGSECQSDSEGYYFKKGELRKIYSGWKIIDYQEYEEKGNKMALIIATR